MLVTKSDIAPAPLLWVATAGNTLGALTTWLLGRLTAMGYAVENLTKDHHQKSVQMVRQWGVLALFFAWLPIIGDALCFAAGFLRLPFLASCAAIAMGKAVRYAALIYALT